MTRKVFPVCRTLALFALALVAGLLMQSISAPAHSSAARANQDVLHVVEHNINYTYVDNGVQGDSPGDLIVFANPIYDSSDRVAIGRDSGFCMRTIVGTAYECNWTVFLPNGQITLEGPSYDRADSMVAITGGTGSYSHARGQMLLHARDQAGTEYDYTFYMN